MNDYENMLRFSQAVARAKACSETDDEFLQACDEAGINESDLTCEEFRRRTAKFWSLLSEIRSRKEREWDSAHKPMWHRIGHAIAHRLSRSA